ncbi:MAG: hypothetical protein K0S47_1331 [Herbinix sp.]|nr:hypothetical protein [Herbinix sp.]
MKYISGETNFEFHNSAVTLGKFDGLHLGHQHLISHITASKKNGLTAIMLSFVSPRLEESSEKEFELIYTEEEKVKKAQDCGVDVLISYPFTNEIKYMEPEDFIKDILVKQLDSKLIVVGSDFRFGFQRRGDVHYLRDFAKKYGFEVVVCEKRTWKEHIISSSTIRTELRLGHMEEANSMLGQPYTIQGEVLHGRKIGRTLGMPTTNILPRAYKLLPPNGVYASYTIIDGVSYAGVTNIGYKPTVGAEEQKGVETYIFDFDGDLYGKIIEVQLITYERPELKFGSLEELKSRMEEDITITRAYFNLTQ